MKCREEILNWELKGDKQSPTTGKMKFSVARIRGEAKRERSIVSRLGIFVAQTPRSDQKPLTEGEMTREKK